MAEAGNTYQLEPEKDEIFFPSRVKAIIESTFTEKLKNVTYDAATSAELT